MKIWFDADNAPHVLVMAPIAQVLKKNGHQVFFTARDRANTCELLDLYGIDYLKTNKEKTASSRIMKILGIVKRSFWLITLARKWHADISFGHGSRSLPIASFVLGVRSITMYDYEWVDPKIFNKLCAAIFLPRYITKSRADEAGINEHKIMYYNGFKEEIYLSSVARNSSICEDLGLKQNSLKVLLRPPAITAHYHNETSEILMEAIIEKLLRREDIQIVWVPRYRTPERIEKELKKQSGRIVMLKQFYDGPSLINEMDVVIGGGGTMTREAAIMGKKSISFFMGKMGCVDETLASMGKLELVRSLDAVDLLEIASKHGTSNININSELTLEIANMILATADSSK